MVKVHFQDLGLSGLHPPAAEPDRQACQALSPCLAPAPAGRAAPAGKAPSAEAVCGRQQARPVPAVSLGLRCPRPGVGIGRPRPVPQSAATASQLLKDGQAQNGTVRHVREPSARLANHGGCGKAGQSHGVRKAPTCRQSERWGGPACPTLSPGGPRSPRGLQRARRPLAVLGRRVSAEADSASPTLRANARSEDPGT